MKKIISIFGVIALVSFDLGFAGFWFDNNYWFKVVKQRQEKFFRKQFLNVRKIPFMQIDESVRQVNKRVSNVITKDRDNDNLEKSTKKNNDNNENKNFENTNKTIFKKQSKEDISSQSKKTSSNSQMLSIDKNVEVLGEASEAVKGTVDQNVVNALKTLKNQTLQKVQVDDTIKKKFGDIDVSKFDFNIEYKPDKVVTFSDIRKLIKKSLLNYKIIFKCGTDLADDVVCTKLDNLISQIDDFDKPGKVFTINNLYKAMLILNELEKYEALYLLYNTVKGGTLLFIVDKKKDIISEIDFVKTYSSADDDTNDFIVFGNNDVDISIQNNVPTCATNEVCFVLGLDGDYIKGFKIYPLDKDLKINGAKMYKIMKVKDMHLVSDCDFTDSVWLKYKNGKLTDIGMGHNGVNLVPDGAIGIEFDLIKKCYKLVK